MMVGQTLRPALMLPIVHYYEDGKGFFGAGFHDSVNKPPDIQEIMLMSRI